MRKFEYKYKIDRDKNTIVAMSTFAGKVVTGVARCAPADTFNVETGKLTSFFSSLDYEVTIC